MTADKLRPTRAYPDLTIAQAEQVRREYPPSTDPWLYEYEVDSKGRVVDRYRKTREVIHSLALCEQ